MIDEYIDALLVDLRETVETIKFLRLKVVTIYIGGGTPSVLSEENTARLLKAVNEIFCLSAHTEFTVEVNPKTIDKEKDR